MLEVQPNAEDVALCWRCGPILEVWPILMLEMQPNVEEVTQCWRCGLILEMWRNFGGLA